jgi:hypothetical protein
MLCIGTGLYNNVAISTLSFNGSTTGWTLIKRQNDGTHAATTELECKASPATSTTANAVVTMSTPPAAPWGFIVFSLSGTKTASFSEGAAGATDLVSGTPNAATGNTVNVTTTVDGDWVIDATVSTSASSIAPGGSQTQIGSTLAFNGSSVNGQLMMSYQQVHPTATATQSWTWTGGAAASAIAAGAIEPASFSAGGGTNGVQVSIGLP